jgi:hypothetical protein
MAVNKGAPMFNTKKYLLPVFALACAAPALAQAADGPKFYRFDFVVKEVEAGKVVNARNYSTMLGSNPPPASIRSGTRLPYSSGGSTQYIDLGVNIDIRELKETPQGELSVYITADISTAAQDNPGSLPLIRQNKWTGIVLVPIKKAATLFSSDDLASKRQLQLEVTATPLAR